MEIQDPYAELEVSPTSSPEEIQRSYHRLCKIHHPDTNIAAWEQKLIDTGLKGEQVTQILKQKINESVKKMQRLTAAYEQICLKLNGAAQPFTTPTAPYNKWTDPEFINKLQQDLQEIIDNLQANTRAAWIEEPESGPKINFWWQDPFKFALACVIWMMASALLVVILARTDPTRSLTPFFFLPYGILVAQYAAASQLVIKIRHGFGLKILWAPIVIVTLCMMVLAILGEGFHPLFSPNTILLPPIISVLLFREAMYSPQPVSVKSLLLLVGILAIISFLARPAELILWVGTWAVSTYLFTRHQ